MVTDVELAVQEAEDELKALYSEDEFAVVHEVLVKLYNAGYVAGREYEQLQK